MIKRGFVVIVVTFLLVSCSKVDIKQVSERDRALEVLTSKLELIKKEMQEDKVSTLVDMLDISIIKNYKIKRLLNNLPQGVKFYYTKPEFEKDSVKNSVGLRYGENIFYLDVEYSYKNKEWRVIDIKERGD